MAHQLGLSELAAQILCNHLEKFDPRGGSGAGYKPVQERSEQENRQAYQELVVAGLLEPKSVYSTGAGIVQTYQLTKKGKALKVVDAEG